MERTGHRGKDHRAHFGLDSHFMAKHHLCLVLKNSSLIDVVVEGASELKSCFGGSQSCLCLQVSFTINQFFGRGNWHIELLYIMCLCISLFLKSLLFVAEMVCSQNIFPDVRITVMPRSLLQ